MGVITLSLPDETERLLRELAEREFGKKKGAISKLIQKILENYVKSMDIEEILKKFSFSYKGKIDLKRDDIWERSWTQWFGSMPSGKSRRTRKKQRN